MVMPSEPLPEDWVMETASAYHAELFFVTCSARRQPRRAGPPPARTSLAPSCNTEGTARSRISSDGALQLPTLHASGFEFVTISEPSLHLLDGQLVTHKSWQSRCINNDHAMTRCSEAMLYPQSRYLWSRRGVD